MKRMDGKVAIYVPLGYTPVLHMVQKELAHKFGGTTTFHTDGSWIDSDGDLVEEGMEVVTSWYSLKEHLKVVDFMIDLARKVKTKANQELVTVEVEGEMLLV